MAGAVKNDGGAAFPGEKDVRWGQPNDCNEGMTLRDYFAAHAPKNPQPWFQPLMSPKPEPVYDHEHPSPNCFECYETNWQERADWNTEHAKQRLIQWPYAWADAQLIARGER